MADPIVVTYTTQTLKVYVHHERDQVRGYTGNVLDGDVRGGRRLVDLAVRHASGSDGRFTSPLSAEDWDSRANTTHDKGEYTFAHLPADMDIVVHATARDGYMLLDLHGLDTYRNMAENGVMGGAFGAMGGWGHTVTLCPLTEVEPTGQDFGKCGSFAVVTTHNVSAEVSKNSVSKSGTTFSEKSGTTVKDITVSLTPVAGKNLGGVGRSFTTAASDDPTTAINEKKDHDFGTMAAGAYDLGLPDGWMGMAGDMKAADALSPLASDLDIKVTPSTATLYGFVRNTVGFGLENVTVTVNGMTATTDDQGRYIVSGISAVRDQLFVNTERAGYPAAKQDSTNNAKTAVPEFAANTTTRHDIELSGANNTVAITGTVTESGTGAGIKGVEIRVDGKAPLNAGSGQGSGKLLTGDDGSYTAVVATQPFNDPLVTVTARKSGYHFLPESSPVAAIAGANPTANFEGRKATEIVGSVTAPGGGMPRSEVTVTAWGDRAMTTDSLYAVTTTETGTFKVFVPTLSGTVYLDAKPQDDYDPTHPNFLNLRDAERYIWFDPPVARPDGSIAVIPGQTLQFGTFTGNSVQPRITSVRRVTIRDSYEGESATYPTAIVPAAADRTPGEFLLVQGEPTDTIFVTWHYETRTTYDGGDLPGSTHSAQNVEGTAVGTGPSLTTALGARFTSFAAPSDGVETPVSAIRGTRTGPIVAGTGARAGTLDRGTAGAGTTVRHDRVTRYIIPEADDDDYRDIHVKIGHQVVDGAGVERDAGAAVSVAEALAGAPHGATGLTAGVKVTENEGDRDDHMLSASWFGKGSPQLEQRIALELLVEDSGPTGTKWEWVVFGDTPEEPDIDRATNPDTDSGPTKWAKWSSAEFDINLAANAGGADNWLDDDDSDLGYTVTAENLKDVRSFRIDTRVDNSGKWTKGTAVTISR